MTHSFNTEIAKKYGIEGAILIENIAFWIKKNIANKKNFHNNKCYTYNSVKAFSELFEYMTKKTILYALKKLEENKIIESENFNNNQYDRTKYYTIIDKEICQIYNIDYSICKNGVEEEYEKEEKKNENYENTTEEELKNEEPKRENAFDKNGQWIVPNCQMDCPNLSNGLSDFVKPIPDNNTNNNINTYTNTNIITSELDNLVNHDAVDYENLNSQKNNFENQDINQSDFQADDKAILSASDNLKPHAHSSPENPFTESPPAADSQLQKIMQAEKQELINFKNELLKSYSRLMGRMPSELKQTETLKTEKARAELKAIFKARKYDWRACIEYAERKVERHDFDFRWYNFLKILKRILEGGTEDDTIPVHYSAEKRYFNDLERQKKHEAELKRWEAEAYAEEKKRADEQGITVEELKKQEAKKMENFEADFIKQMKACALA